MSFTELVGPVAGGRLHEDRFQGGLGDVAPSGRVRLDTIARWVQDVAYADLEASGLADRAAWVVRRTRLKVERFPVFREAVTATTFASGFGRMWAERRTTLVGHTARVEAVARKVVAVDSSELAKAEGGVTCCAVLVAPASGRP